MVFFQFFTSISTYYVCIRSFPAELWQICVAYKRNLDNERKRKKDPH